MESVNSMGVTVCDSAPGRSSASGPVSSSARPAVAETPSALRAVPLVPGCDVPLDAASGQAIVPLCSTTDETVPELGETPCALLAVPLVPSCDVPLGETSGQAIVPLYPTVGGTVPEAGETPRALLAVPLVPRCDVPLGAISGLAIVPLYPRADDTCVAAARWQTWRSVLRHTPRA